MLKKYLIDSDVSFDFICVCTETLGLQSHAELCLPTVGLTSTDCQRKQRPEVGSVCEVKQPFTVTLTD